MRGVHGGLAADYWPHSKWGGASVKEDASTSFRPDPNGRHRYHKEKMEPKQVEDHIETILRNLPVR